MMACISLSWKEIAGEEGVPSMMLTYDDEGECRRELEEAEMDSRPGMDREWGDCWGEWLMPKAERLLETRPMGGEWDGS